MFFTTNEMFEMLEPDYDWGQFHTKQLLNMRHYYNEYFEPTPKEVRGIRLTEAVQTRLREVLATREHVPNKLERKAERQAKAKAQRNR